MRTPDRDRQRVSPISRDESTSPQSRQRSTWTPVSHQGEVDEGDVSLFRQPKTREITHDQLVNEVKGIYAGLVMVEKKCVEIDLQQSQSNTKLSAEQWQALTALHRTLLHEHHDFFLASQHPTASDALRKLATKYAMPARMWRHGIHSFLELLRHRLPDSLEFMLTFVYLAYSMTALLMESVPSFLETWIECLGDLARYRMAIEEADLRDREIWSSVARMWYNKAADKSPNVGRIQHHLAVLARPNIVQQLFYYSKALVSITPFFNARESIMLLFAPFLDNSEVNSQKYAPAEIAFVKAHGFLFTGRMQEYPMLMNEFMSGLDGLIARGSARFRVQGPELACGLFASSFGFGDYSVSVLLRLFFAEFRTQLKLRGEATETNQISEAAKTQMEFQPDFVISAQEEMKERLSRPPDPTREYPQLTHSTSDRTTQDAAFSGSHDTTTVTCERIGQFFSVVSVRIGDKNVLPTMHTSFAWLWSLCHIPGAIEYVEEYIPWEQLATFLNTLGRSGIVEANIERSSFPPTISGTGPQLPEDFAMRGWLWTQFYHPAGFFKGQVVDEDERALEPPSLTPPREERCLWLGVRLASVKRWWTYNSATKKFTPTPLAIALRQKRAHHTFIPPSTSSDGDLEMTQ